MRLKYAICLIYAVMMLVPLAGCAVQAAAPDLLEPVISSRDTARAEYRDIRLVSVIEASVAPRVEGLGFTVPGTVGGYAVTLGERVKQGALLVRADTSRLIELRDNLNAEIALQTELDAVKRESAQITLEGLSGAEYELSKNEFEHAAAMREKQLEELREALEKCLSDIEQSEIRAPFDATVVRIANTEGRYVLENEPVIYLSKDGEAYLYCKYMTEKEISTMAAYRAYIGGETYELEYAPYESGEYASAIKSLDERTRFKVLCDNGAEVVGRYTQLELVYAELEDVLALPTGAVQKDYNGYFVYLAKDGRQERREVETGLITDAWTQILSGVEEGDEVYVS